ncbi:MAG: hypothetical protein QM730_15225 [Anaerolineales bacterium]
MPSLAVPHSSLQAGPIVYGSVVERLAMQVADRFPVLVRYLPANLSGVLQTFNAALDRSAAPLAADAASMPEMRAVLLIGLLFIAISTASFVIFSRQDLGG